MNAATPPGTQNTAMVTAGLGVVFVLGNAFTAYMINASWGGANWVANLVFGVVICSLALLRAWHPARMAVAGSAVATVAVVMSVIGDFPHEPGPITAFALAMPVGSAIRSPSHRPGGHGTPSTVSLPHLLCAHWRCCVIGI